MSKREILDKLGRKCSSCGSTENLHIHHKLPHWLWAYVGKTDGGKFSIEFIDNYEVLCNECHRRKHKFLSYNLVLGFKYHYGIEIRWKPPNHLNSFPYPVYFSKDYWKVATFAGEWVWNSKSKTATSD